MSLLARRAISQIRRPLASAVKHVLNILGFHLIRRESAWELVEREAVSRFIQEFKVDCVFDVGANFGQYASRLREMGYRGDIVSFEPIPEVAKVLRKMAAKDPRWFVEEMALGRSAGVAPFNVTMNTEFSSLHVPRHDESSLFEKFNVIKEIVSVRLERLDSVFLLYQDRLKFKRPFLKMDTQGNDLDVASGAGACLSLFTGIQSELSFRRIYEGQPLFIESLKVFESAGFSLTSLFPNTVSHFPTLVEMDCIMYNRDSIDRLEPRRFADLGQKCGD